MFRTEHMNTETILAIGGTVMAVVGAVVGSIFWLQSSFVSAEDYTSDKKHVIVVAQALDSAPATQIDALSNRLEVKILSDEVTQVQSRLFQVEDRIPEAKTLKEKELLKEQKRELNDRFLTSSSKLAESLKRQRFLDEKVAAQRKPLFQFNSPMLEAVVPEPIPACGGESGQC